MYLSPRCLQEFSISSMALFGDVATLEKGQSLAWTREFLAHKTPQCSTVRQN